MSDMPDSIVIRECTVPYTQVLTAVLVDSGLSYGARGLYGYLRTLGADRRVWVPQLVEASPDSGRLVERCVRELREAGYLVRQFVRKGGKIWKSHYVFCADGDCSGVERFVEVVEGEGEKPLVVAIGQALPDPDHDRCHHGRLRRSCEKCRSNFRALAAGVPESEI